MCTIFFVDISRIYFDWEKKCHEKLCIFFIWFPFVLVELMFIKRVLGGSVDVIAMVRWLGWGLVTHPNTSRDPMNVKHQNTYRGNKKMIMYQKGSGSNCSKALASPQLSPAVQGRAHSWFRCLCPLEAQVYSSWVCFQLPPLPISVWSGTWNLWVR